MSFASGADIVALQTEVNVLCNTLKGIVSAIPNIVGLSNATLPKDFTMPDPAAPTNLG
ncbi:hypothetical protein HETIRDRAFT_166020 [Heterobasidion irregulare TC 32-1]|uniref:Uncharacterized protein n=1 Tax=Heterobasidion irregulare (strain TC 32-1) TaxID=747525 RepID=W4KMA4_HETIT|nr:uncharacterized protein HETIRDRAFT_166020 [Heterobasidion irregulare TC 32-1]ETW86510.1 hypothetical protein HETIRDRAFT_166020 [Heterobasidion irregulare TC 32-1]